MRDREHSYSKPKRSSGREESVTLRRRTFNNWNSRSMSVTWLLTVPHTLALLVDEYFLSSFSLFSLSLISLMWHSLDVEGLVRECVSWSEFAEKLAPSTSSATSSAAEEERAERECVVSVVKEMLPQASEQEIQVLLEREREREREGEGI